MKTLVATLLGLCMTYTGFSQPNKPQYTLVITNANIVNVAEGKIESGRLIAISGNTIQAIDDTRKSAQYKAARSIDLGGKYIIPGLWDNHVHFRGGDSLIEANKALLPLFLAYGITTVRDCGGDITPAVMDWKKQIEAGTLAGPRIFSSGPKIDGPGATWAGSLEVTTPGEVSKALDSLKKLKVDYVKLYDSKVSREAFLETISQAQQQGMKTSGHMPYTVKLREAVDRGLDGSEHLYYVIKACSAKEDSITNAIIQSEKTTKPIGLFAALPTIYDTYDQPTADKLFRHLAEKRVSIVPTLFISKTLGEIKETDHTADSLLPYIDKKIQATYAGRIASAKRQSDESTRFSKQFAAKAASLVPQLFRSGVNIMAGSDCGASNSYVYPGSSLHEEIKLIAASGLTPAQALQTSTINGSKFFGVEKTYGSIQKGKSSDLVVLEENPLTNINAIDNINMVLSNGKMYSKKELNDLLHAIRK
ncbi:amidohydrolase [Segetibacter sp. 3557_3]|uniref:amidohydrolase family protein n=1 Tax=Segetibacter sp. 3557_3 TaxID=2547429 RepID=UPI001058A0A8|nr:amidohydrolase family protein [Segetibacter sp. 3557_3]TDH26997.1 amidohydrolase [Segetibacter sp. 3557_3]